MCWQAASQADLRVLAVSRDNMSEYERPCRDHHDVCVVGAQMATALFDG